MIDMLIRFRNLSTFVSTLKSKIYKNMRRYAKGQEIEQNAKSGLKSSKTRYILA